MMKCQLDQLWKKGQEFLGVKYPIIAGAMTWISNSRLVAAVGKAGGFGCLAGGNLGPEDLGEEIDATRQLTDVPFAVNLITIAPNYQHQLRVAVEKRAPFIVFAGSFPRASEVATARENGARVLAFASTESIARRMIDSGVDALILEGSEAGGHIGHESLIVLLQQVLFSIESTPVFVAGGIATGRMMAHLLLMGAAGIQMGTRFVATEECEVHPDFKQTFLRAKARDAIATPAVSSDLHVVAVRALRNEGTKNFENLQLELIGKVRAGTISQKEAQYEVERFWVGALRRAAIDGDVKKGSLMAGQSVGLVDRVMTIRELFDDMIGDAEHELARITEECRDLADKPNHE